MGAKGLPCYIYENLPCNAGCYIQGVLYSASIYTHTLVEVATPHHATQHYPATAGHCLLNHSALFYLSIATIIDPSMCYGRNTHTAPNKLADLHYSFLKPLILGLGILVLELILFMKNLNLKYFILIQGNSMTDI